jgi:hypothetical protein
MRTIAIVFALALIAGTAPAAPYTRDHLSTAVLLFTAALAVLLAASLVSGWRLFDMRALTRVSKGTPASGPTPVMPPVLWPVSSLSVDHPRIAAYSAQQVFSRSPSWSLGPTINDSSASGRIALSELAMSAPQPEPAGSGSMSNGASSSHAATTGAARSESLGVPS